MRETEEDEAGSEDRGGDGDHLEQSADRFTDHKSERRDQGSDTGRAHEEAESMGAAVEDLGGEDGHEHHVGHAHEVDQREEEQDGADGDEGGDVLPSLAELMDHRGG